MASINSLREFEKWLAGKPREWGQVIALRAVLRVLPFVQDTQLEAKNDRYLLNLFRLVFTSWVAIQRPEWDTKSGVKDAVASYLEQHRDRESVNNLSNSYYIGLAAYAAARAVFVDTVKQSNAESVAAVKDADSISLLPDNHFWQNLSQDCSELEYHKTPKIAPVKLSGSALWNQKGVPWSERGSSQYQIARQMFGAYLKRLDQGYAIWLSWYNRRVRGNTFPFRISDDKSGRSNDFVLGKIFKPENFEMWDEGPSAIHIRIQGWIDEAQQGRETEPIDQNLNESFFVSYAHQDEGMAREIVDILNLRGYSSIAQFKDFSQGNFVREMREGIARTDRFIALQSKSYWNSDHCQSEWDAAYARDPGAKQRKILPFLLEPTELPPIASEIVYQPLFNLSKAKRRAAIIAWIEYQPPSLSPLELRKTLAEQASPDVRLENNKIDAGPNTLFDKPLVDLDLAELPGNLRALAKVLLESLPSNTPKIVRSCLVGYHDHLVERGTQPIVGTIIPYAEAIKAQVASDAGYWDEGLESLFNSFLKRHELLITHYPLNPIRELTVAETPIDEIKASGGSILGPIEAVAKTMEGLKSADLTTDDFNRVDEAHRAFSRDIASLPMPNSNDDVTPKRRYVLGTIGFYERLLAALGSSAGIASSAAGQAAISAVKKAIDVFMKFVL